MTHERTPFIDVREHLGYTARQAARCSPVRVERAAAR
jgi:hypothetical protein